MLWFFLLVCFSPVTTTHLQELEFLNATSWNPSPSHYESQSLSVAANWEQMGNALQPGHPKALIGDARRSRTVAQSGTALFTFQKTEVGRLQQPVHDVRRKSLPFPRARGAL